MRQQTARLLLTTRGGHKREVQGDTRVLASIDGPPTETLASRLRVGDYLGIRYGDHEWPKAPTMLPQLPDRRRRGSEKAVALPTVMTSELAFLLGAMRQRDTRLAATGQ